MQDIEMYEVICGLRLGDAHSQNHEGKLLQQNLACSLVDSYMSPDSDRPYDKWQVDRLRKMGKYQLDQLNRRTYLRVQTFYEACSWAFPTHRFFLWLGIDFTSMLTKVVPWSGINLYAFIGAFELILIGKHIFNHVFFSAQNPQHRLTWDKFKNLIMKDSRPTRLTKVVLWLTTSIVMLVATGGFSLFFQLGILALDTAMNIWLRNRKINQSKEALESINKKNDPQLQAIAPFLENEILFQRRRHRFYLGVSAIMIGSTVAFLPFVLIPAVIGFGMMALGGLAVIKQSFNLGLAGLFKIFDGSMKANYGVRSARKNVPENDIKLEDQEILVPAKAEVLAVIEDYKKSCSRINYYGYNRANELQKRIEYARNMNFLRDEIAYFLKTGQTESDRANYNILRSTSRRSGFGSHDLRGRLLESLVPTKSFYRKHPHLIGSDKINELRHFDFDVMKQDLVFKADAAKPAHSGIDINNAEQESLTTAKIKVAMLVDSYKKQCGLFNFYGYNRAVELQDTVRNADSVESLREDVADFLKTGKTGQDYKRYHFFRSFSRSSGHGSESLRGQLYDKLVPSNSTYKYHSWMRAVKMREFENLEENHIKQKIVI